MNSQRSNPTSKVVIVLAGAVPAPRKRPFTQAGAAFLHTTGGAPILIQAPLLRRWDALRCSQWRFHAEPAFVSNPCIVRPDRPGFGRRAASKAGGEAGSAGQNCLSAVHRSE